jgi:hypothetical protein
LKVVTIDTFRSEELDASLQKGLVKLPVGGCRTRRGNDEGCQ